MKAPRNTAQEAKDDTLSVLAGAMVEGSSNHITNMERRGQGEFVGSDTLPTSFGHLENGKEIMESWGITFLGVVDGDPIFQYVQLPEGWEKVPIDHDMWSKLVDDKGRERASIFYKAAFYDRRASCHLSRRYNYHFDYDKLDTKKVGVAVITDAGNVIHTTRPIKETTGMKSRDISSEANDRARAWLAANYPDYENPAAYWDEGGSQCT